MNPIPEIQTAKYTKYTKAKKFGQTFPFSKMALRPGTGALRINRQLSCV
jgi:hypothetical protein